MAGLYVVAWLHPHPVGLSHVEMLHICIYIHVNIHKLTIYTISLTVSQGSGHHQKTFYLLIPVIGQMRTEVTTCVAMGTTTP